MNCISGHCRILIVDDSEEDYESLARAFKKVALMAEFSWCQSGQEALGFLRRQDDDHSLPLLIIADLNMPGLDGCQTLQAIKEDENLKAIPVIIFTTSDNPDDVRNCYQSGANTYIQKPDNFAGLTEVARHIKDYWLETALLAKNSAATPRKMARAG